MTQCFRQKIVIRIDGHDVATFNALDPCGGMMVQILHPLIADGISELLDSLLEDYTTEDDGDLIVLDYDIKNAE